MTVKFSISLTRRLNAEIRRAIGSSASVVFYTGDPPLRAEDHPTGDKIDLEQLTEDEVQQINFAEVHQQMPADAKYWRIIDAGGLVIVQGEREHDG